MVEFNAETGFTPGTNALNVSLLSSVASFVKIKRWIFAFWNIKGHWARFVMTLSSILTIWKPDNSGLIWRSPEKIHLELNSWFSFK